MTIIELEEPITRQLKDTISISKKIGSLPFDLSAFLYLPVHCMQFAYNVIPGCHNINKYDMIS